MLKYWLLAAAFGLLSMGLRGIGHPVPHRIGTLCLLVTSYFIGYAITGKWWIGALSVVTWFLLPWVEILTRLSRVRLPEIKTLDSRRAPTGEQFPVLRDITRELESEGFEQIDDVGWEWEGHSQFFRLFYHEEERTQASICLIDEGDFAFYYLSFSSRDVEGVNWTTWNFPFSTSLRMPPSIRINRVVKDFSAGELFDRHREFFAKEARKPVAYSEEGVLRSEIERELREQMAYNIDRGILVRDGEGKVRYTLCGKFYVWGQFLLEFVRFW